MKRFISTVALAASLFTSLSGVAQANGISRTDTIRAASQLARAAYEVSNYRPNDYRNTSFHSEKIGQIAGRIEMAARNYQDVGVVLRAANEAVGHYIYARPHIEEIWSAQDRYWIRGQLLTNLNRLLFVLGEPETRTIPQDQDLNREPEEVNEYSGAVWSDHSSGGSVGGGGRQPGGWEH